MEVVVKHQVSCCHACPKSGNTARDHDDPFTSAPIGTWYCGTTGGPSYIEDPFVIHKKCPLLKGVSNG